MYRCMYVCVCINVSMYVSMDVCMHVQKHTSSNIQISVFSLRFMHGFSPSRSEGSYHEPPRAVNETQDLYISHLANTMSLPSRQGGAEFLQNEFFLHKHSLQLLQCSACPHAFSPQPTFSHEVVGAMLSSPPRRHHQPAICKWNASTSSFHSCMSGCASCAHFFRCSCLSRGRPAMS